MKKKICVMAMSALMLTACSDEIENEINGSQTSEGARYMAINIVSNGAATTRAESDPAFSNGDEYQISNVLFYFFDKNGDPYYVATNASGERVNYTTPKDVDLSGTEYATSDGNAYSNGTNTQNADGSNVTLSKSIVVIEPKYEDGTLPSQVVALINYNNASVFTPATYKLDDLRKVDVKQGYYTETNSGTTTYYYLMSNSVYKAPVYDTSNSTTITGYTEQYAVPITEDNISATATGGTAVNIYVERVVAKVATIYNTTSTDNKKATAYTPSTSSTTTYYVFPNAKYVGSTATKTAIKKLDNETAVNVEDLQIMITGYSYYNNSSKATLLKNIESNEGYNKVILGASTTTSADDFLSKWNDPQNFRSYWADSIANTTATVDNNNVVTDYISTQQIAYKDITTATAGYMYPFENTRKILNTGIIFSAQLVTKDASANTYTAQPLVKWLSTYYTPDAALAAIATYLSTDYAKTAYSSETNAAAQTAIAAGDLEFVTNGDDFHAKVQFKSSVTTIYKKGGATGITGEDLKAVTNAVPSIQYWNDGKCYFFAQITQLPGTIGVSGVVRNHWYQMTVNSISGLGTPVADPEQAVTPVKPTEDEWYISTSINVLAWKRSYQGVDLTTD